MPCSDCERMLTEICKDGRGMGGAVTDGLVRPAEVLRPYGASFFLLVSVKNERETAAWTAGCRRRTLRLKICCRSVTFVLYDIISCYP